MELPLMSGTHRSATTSPGVTTVLAVVGGTPVAPRAGLKAGFDHAVQANPVLDSSCLNRRIAAWREPRRLPLPLQSPSLSVPEPSATISSSPIAAAQATRVATGTSSSSSSTPDVALVRPATCARARAQPWPLSRIAKQPVLCRHMCRVPRALAAPWPAGATGPPCLAGPMWPWDARVVPAGHARRCARRPTPNSARWPLFFFYFLYIQICCKFNFFLQDSFTSENCEINFYE
jgi:hypothetical protein